MSEYSIDITFNDEFGSQGTGNGEFSYSSGVVILNNEVYVVDKQNHRIQVFDLAGVYQRQFGSVGSGNDNFFFPERITTDGTNLYITDSANHRIKKHQPDGTFILEFGSDGTGNNNFKYPVGIAYNSGNLYIADKQNHRIKTHLIDGTYISDFGAYGSNDNNLNFPEGVEIVNSDIIVADSGNNEVKTFNISGVFIKKVSGIIFGYPIDIVRITGNIFGVVDKTRNLLHFFDDTGNNIGEFGNSGSGDGEFFFPIAGSYDNEKLFITDSGNFRVEILNAIPEITVAVYKDDLVKLSEQLYPTGRAWWLQLNTVFRNLHEGLALSESRALEFNTNLLNSILPDNDNFSTDDAANLERALGLFIQPSVNLEDRKAAILRKMQHPGNIPARQHYLYLQGQLQAAGFNVYVHENRVPLGGGQYEVRNIIPAICGEFNYNDTVYNNLGISGSFSKLANYIDEDKDSGFVFGNDINLRATFFIGGEIFGDYADVSELRKKEFRELILKIKPAQTACWLLINYI